MSIQLTTGTIASLQECEAVIARGLKTFVEVGTALLTIKQQKLYKNTHPNFNDYCKDRWNFTQQHAGRLIVATKVVDIIESEPIGLSPPQSESQTRALAKSANPVADWKTAQEITGKDQPTAKEISTIVKPKKKLIVPSRRTGFAPRPVMQILASGETYVYDSIAKASRATKTKGTNISKVASGKRPFAGGFKWKYVDEQSSVRKENLHKEIQC